MKRVLLTVLFVLVAAPVLAQAITRGPVPATAKFAFDAPSNVTTVTQALTFEPRVYRNGAPLTVLTNVTCQALANPARITCQAPVSASNLDAINQAGVHNLTLSLFRLDVLEGEKSVPFSLTTPAGAPTAFQLIP